ncbi:fimbrial protein [Enterobacter cloacae]|uniref:fimbrial protein n=1 Tax=Enterobacter cloacae TaxID=550 RepID=UPI002FF72E15
MAVRVHFKGKFMKSSFYFSGVLLSFLLCMFPFKQASAVTSCSISTITDTIPLSLSNLSVSPDMPDGTIIYRLKATPFNTPDLVCRSDTAEEYSISSYLVLRNEPLPLSSWSGNPFAGKVYQTGIPGIGVAIWFSGQAATYAEPQLIRTYSYSFQGTLNIATLLNVFDITFLKIGPVSPGTINASNLPQPKIEIRAASSNITNLPVTLRNVNFTGSINITAPSCQTPDVTVNMGETEIRNTFRGIGSTSGWVNANFTLVNCPVFYGTYNTGVYLEHNNATGTVTVPDSVPNLLSVTIMPFTPMIDSENGIFAIDSSLPDSGSGVGIQLGYDSGSINPLNLSTPLIYTTNSQGDPTITLPFRARYIQTEKIVSPGRANGKISVIINYK